MLLSRPVWSSRGDEIDSQGLGRRAYDSPVALELVAIAVDQQRVALAVVLLAVKTTEPGVTTLSSTVPLEEVAGKLRPGARFSTSRPLFSDRASPQPAPVRR
jgi:hypothetical protein